MAYQRGETIICSVEVKDSAGDYTDPATSMKITIKNRGGAAMVDSQDMTKDDTGKYHYDYTSSATNKLGKYGVWFNAVDGTRTTIAVNSFVLEE